MDKTKSSSRRLPAILLIVTGLAGLILGILGFINGGRMEPYETRNGIVWVRSYVVGDEKSSTGTGWAIGKPGEPVQYIVTNAHVVEKAYTAPATATRTIQVFFSEAENDFSETQVVFYSPPNQKDIAILKLPSPTDKRVALRLRNSDSVAIGETAFALGYPGLSSNAQQFKTYNKDDVTITRGIISKRAVPAQTTFDSFQMDVSILGGNSGGPLVDTNGFVIGINTLGFDVGMNWAIAIDELTKILDAERIQYTMANTTFSWMQDWMKYAFLGLGLLAMAGGLYLMAAGKRSDPSAEELSDNSRAAGGAAAGRGPVKKKAVLRGVTGRYAGQSFDLEKAKVIIGRDPAAANIVFDESTPGISRRHCQIVYDPSEDVFLITDLGSSYGTFLGNGKKLPANVPEKISAGDTFYLSDSANRFLVTKE